MKWELDNCLMWICDCIIGVLFRCFTVAAVVELLYRNGNFTVFLRMELHSCLRWTLDSCLRWTLDSCLRWTLDSCLRWMDSSLR